jgi:signal transduction histidine kinase
VSLTGINVIVNDDGPGIPVAERGNVFKRFYRVESSRGTPGSGLGLSLVDAIAKLHHARIDLADNDPGLCVTAVFSTSRPRSTKEGNFGTSGRIPSLKRESCEGRFGIPISHSR